jgi:hypothetical protein
MMKRNGIQVEGTRILIVFSDNGRKIVYQCIMYSYSDVLMYPGDPSPRYTPGLQGQRCYRREFFKQNMLCPVYNNKYLAKLKCIQ